MSGLLAVAPLLAVAIGALIVLVLEAFTRPRRAEPLGYLSAAFLSVAAVLGARSWGRDYSGFGGQIVLDRTAVLLCVAMAVAGVFVVFMSLRYLPRRGMDRAEYYALLLFAVLGSMIMVSTTSLLVVFLGLEVLSVASYALAGLRKDDPRSVEAAVKYFLMGSFAAAFFVFGLAFLHGAAGGLEFGRVWGELGSAAAGLRTALWAGMALVVTGFGFKIALAPFHMWAPDVYEGAPTPVTAFFAVGPKLAGLAVLFRFLAPLGKGGGARPVLFWLVWAVAALTMVLGNFGALRQTNVKRLLAYSSIAHSGYILVAVLAADGAGLLFYLVAYLFMAGGAFAVLIAAERAGTNGGGISDLAGLGRTHPWLAAMFAVFLVSLAGFPPTAGFLAKFYVFSAAVRQGHVVLAVIAVLASLVSVYYYLKVVVVMYMREPGAAAVKVDRENPALDLVLFLCLVGVIQLGVWPGNLVILIRQAAAALF